MFIHESLGVLYTQLCVSPDTLPVNSFVRHVATLSLSVLPGISGLELVTVLPRASGKGQLKRDDTRPETIFRLSAKRTSLFKSAGLQFSRLLAAEECASAVVMLDTTCSEVG